MVQPVLPVQVRAGSIFPCHLSGTECASHNLTGRLTVLYVITCRKSAFVEAGSLVCTPVVSNNHGKTEGGAKTVC